MWTKKEEKPIDLSDSVMLALETLKQAIQIWFGREIAFAGNTKLLPGKIRRHEGGIETRYVMVGVTFHFLDRTAQELPTRVYAEVDLLAKLHVTEATVSEKVWRVDRLHFGLGELEESLRTWYWAHAVGDERILPTIKVGIEMGDGAPDYNWRVGRTIADRHLEPLFPKAS